MKKLIIRMGNHAHRWESPWLRRPVIVLCLASLCIWSALFWLLTPLWVALNFVLSVILGGIEAIKETPGMIAGQARVDAEEWQRNIAGSRRVWKSRKKEPTP